MVRVIVNNHVCHNEALVSRLNVVGTPAFIEDEQAMTHQPEEFLSVLIQIGTGDEHNPMPRRSEGVDALYGPFYRGEFSWWTR